MPVVDSENHYVGMLNPMNLLSKLLDIGRASDGLGGRLIHTSIDLIAKVLHAEILVASEQEQIQDFQVYVSAMSIERFDELLPDDNRHLAIICGDRPEIHLHTLQRKIRLLIITGDQRVESLIMDEANNRGVSILRTSFDSAAAIRRLKFENVEMGEFGTVYTVSFSHSRTSPIFSFSYFHIRTFLSPRPSPPAHCTGTAESARRSARRPW